MSDTENGRPTRNSELGTRNWQDPDEETRARARTFVYERLALLSAVIWALGTLALFIAIVPVVARPQPYIMVASVVPLIPAAIPWLFYGRIADAVAHRWARRAADSETTSPRP